LLAAPAHLALGLYLEEIGSHSGYPLLNGPLGTLSQSHHDDNRSYTDDDT
jgi:hypothetical protein